MGNLKKLRLHINNGDSQEGENSVEQELLMLLKNKMTCIKIYKSDFTYYYIPGFLLFGRVPLEHNLLHGGSKFCFSVDTVWKRNLIPLLYPNSHPLYQGRVSNIYLRKFLFFFYAFCFHFTGEIHRYFSRMLRIIMIM